MSGDLLHTFKKEKSAPIRLFALPIRQNELLKNRFKQADDWPILQSTEHDLEPVAVHVVFDGQAARLPARDAWLYPLVF